AFIALIGKPCVALCFGPDAKPSRTLAHDKAYRFGKQLLASARSEPVASRKSTIMGRHIITMASPCSVPARRVCGGCVADPAPRASRAIDNDLWRPTDEGSAAERPSTATASAASEIHAEGLSRSSTAVARESSSSMTVMTRRAITRKERTARSVFSKVRDNSSRSWRADLRVGEYSAA